MSFTSVSLRSWRDVQGYLKPGWLFRGQKKANWHLRTSLERCCDREQIPARQRRLFEWNLGREFRRAYHHYSSYVPEPNNWLEWLSLMQHHGAPTRLMDFTYSLYIALYIAFEKLDDHQDEDCAVWAVNNEWAMEESIRRMKEASKQDADLLRDAYEESHMDAIPPFFCDAPAVLCACPQNPFRLNQRLQIQKGIFLVPGSVEVSFEDNLTAMHGHDDPANLLKLILPHTERRDALRHLYEMNISRTSLFPGLDGFAQSLGVYHPGYDTTQWLEEEEE